MNGASTPEDHATDEQPPGTSTVDGHEAPATDGHGPETPAADEQAHGFWHGRSALLMPGLLAAFSLFLMIGAGLLDAGDTEFPGPRFFPMILGAIGLLLAVLLALGVLRTPEPVAETSGRYRTYSDFVALAWVVGGFLAFALLLPWLGWILAGALLFWCAAHGFGSRRPLFDILIALFLSSVVYLIFGTGLGLILPSGILGGGF